MSKYRYKFKLSIGFPSADREEEFDLVEDGDWDEEQLEQMAPEDLEALVDREVTEWHYEYAEYWAEKL